MKAFGKKRKEGILELKSTNHKLKTKNYFTAIPTFAPCFFAMLMIWYTSPT